MKSYIMSKVIKAVPVKLGTGYSGLRGCRCRSPS